MSAKSGQELQLVSSQTIVLGVDLDIPKLNAIPKTIPKIMMIKRITPKVTIIVLSRNGKGFLGRYYPWLDSSRVFFLENISNTIYYPPPLTCFSYALNVLLLLSLCSFSSSSRMEVIPAKISADKSAKICYFFRFARTSSLS